MLERAQRRYQAAQARRRVIAAKTRVSQQAADFLQRLGQRPGQRSHGAALGLPVHDARSRGQTLSDNIKQKTRWSSLTVVVRPRERSDPDIVRRNNTTTIIICQRATAIRK